MVAVTYPNLARVAYVPRVLVARRDRRGLYRKCEPVKAGEQGEVVCQMADKTVATLVARVRRLLQCTALALYGCASGAAQFLNAASCG